MENGKFDNRLMEIGELANRLMENRLMENRSIRKQGSSGELANRSNWTTG
jgi:hypothetical protein